MGAAPVGAPRRNLAAVIARSEDWHHLPALKDALGRADCEAQVNPNSLPEDTALAVIDYEVEGGKGIEWLVFIHGTRPDVPVMLLGPADDRAMYAAWAGGAEVYLTVPFDVDELAGFARGAIQTAAKESGTRDGHAAE